ncbi:ArsA family ATPase [Geodermatophilus marinus]|uniref:ArsA family ATPase n=1 Tax=Geodermatophilus sp. LHW52908 TaxID=2303986 RepID=UPI000E3E162D|nr:ArsA-related P-loop ATPase [Geodermatophilus sp. LHW52908]RFU22535.1 ion transporter [Geodermatophilus sp. LHW52908]
MRVLLLTGPGGAGTTTLAAATGVRSARAGARTLLLARPGPLPAGLDAVAGLAVVRPEPLAAAEALWGSLSAELATAAPGLPLPPASSVPLLPGAADLALLTRLAEAGAAAEADTVVVDAGPLPGGPALVALPGALRWWLDRALPGQARVLGAVRTAAVRAGAVPRGPLDVALDAVPRLEALLGRLALDDPATTEVRLVALPRPGAAAALRAAVTALALHGQRPAALLARVLPPAPAGWWAERAAEQDAVLAELAALAPLRTVPEAAAAPAGAAGLAGLLPDDPGSAPPPAAPTVERAPGGRRLVLPLPFAERGDLTLTRAGDDLVVSVAGTRRAVGLDALLRRCRVTSGALADAGTASARLEVTFTPDPEQWPADLLAAEGSTR